MLKSIAPVAISALATFLVHCSDASVLGDRPGKGLDGKTPAEAATSDPAAGPKGSAAAETFARPLPDSPPAVWTWMGPEEFDDVPECMDGSKTGLGINVSPTGSKKVLVFMMGGGACFDGQTCAIADHALSADHADGGDFQDFAKATGAATVMNRDRADNPFKDWNYVYVPYCSGDVFSGATTTGFKGRPQLGFKNVTAYLPRLRSTFRDADQLVLSGTSAGGYGAAYNYVQVQKAFPSLDITVIDDSGPPLGPTFTPTCLQEKWRATWHMDETSPVAGPFPVGVDPGSGQTHGGLLELVGDVVRAHPKSKFAFLSHEGDIVMRYFHGIGHSFNCAAPGLLGLDDFAAGLREVRSIEGENFLTYYGPGRGHQYFMKDAELFDTTVDGVNLAAWLGQIVNGKDAPRRVPAAF